jgi:hypothetical protein
MLDCADPRDGWSGMASENGFTASSSSSDTVRAS